MRPTSQDTQLKTHTQPWDPHSRILNSKLTFNHETHIPGYSTQNSHSTMGPTSLVLNSELTLNHEIHIPGHSTQNSHSIMRPTSQDTQLRTHTQPWNPHPRIFKHRTNAILKLTHWVTSQIVNTQLRAENSHSRIRFLDPRLLWVTSYENSADRFLFLLQCFHNFSRCLWWIRVPISRVFSSVHSCKKEAVQRHCGCDVLPYHLVWRTNFGEHDPPMENRDVAPPQHANAGLPAVQTTKVRIPYNKTHTQTRTHTHTHTESTPVSVGDGIRSTYWTLPCSQYQ